MLIVFEGVEGSGKTTQLQATVTWLHQGKSVPVLVTREPGGTELGGSLRQLLLGGHSQLIHDRAELFLYAADRSQNVEEVLKPQLEKGAIILCDRFTDSTIAYQGYGRGLSMALIDQLNHLATNGLQSDLTLWLDVDVEVGLGRARRRGAADRLESADLDFHRRVQQGYAELAAQDPDRIVRIDASQTVEAVQEQIQKILQLKIEK